MAASSLSKSERLDSVLYSMGVGWVLSLALVYIP
jgi:hypothetical protein